VEGQDNIVNSSLSRREGRVDVSSDLALPLDTLTSKKDAGNRSQKLRLFIRGKLMSAEEHIRGMSQFLNPPMRKGIIKKNTMMTLWPVTMRL